MVLRKAQQDHALAAALVHDPRATDEHVGFLCQQAIEKAIKSVLSKRSIAFRYTHDLRELVDLMKDRGIAFPAALEATVPLTPFAAEARYDDLPPEPGDAPPFDRAEAVAWAALAVAWATDAADVNA